MGCQPLSEAMQLRPIHESISITPISLFFLKAEVKSSDLITQETPFGVCSCCHGNSLPLPLLSDRQMKTRAREQGMLLLLQVHFNAVWRKLERSNARFATALQVSAPQSSHTPGPLGPFFQHIGTHLIHLFLRGPGVLRLCSNSTLHQRTTKIQACYLSQQHGSAQEHAVERSVMEVTCGVFCSRCSRKQ